MRWKVYHEIPQKHWIEMSGRQAKVLIEQALRYRIPIGGATIDLPDAVRALHNFLADKSDVLKASAEIVEFDLRRKRAATETVERNNERDAGRMIDKETAERLRLALVNHFVSVTDRAPAEVMVKLAGLPAKVQRQVRSVLEAYFHDERVKMTSEGSPQPSAFSQRAPADS